MHLFCAIYFPSTGVSAALAKVRGDAVTDAPLGHMPDSHPLLDTLTRACRRDSLPS